MLRSKRNRSDRSLCSSADDGHASGMDSDEVPHAHAHKRVRISRSPGELRLAKDVETLQSLQDTHHLRFTFSEVEGSHGLHISFASSDQLRSLDVEGSEFTGGGGSGELAVCPSRFLLQVPRFFPHGEPQVRCLDRDFGCRYIAGDGRVGHPRLQEGEEGWSAIHGLAEIVECLQDIRALWCSQAGDVQQRSWFLGGCSAPQLQHEQHQLGDECEGSAAGASAMQMQGRAPAAAAGAGVFHSLSDFLPGGDGPGLSNDSSRCSSARTDGAVFDGVSEGLNENGECEGGYESSSVSGLHDAAGEEEEMEWM